MSILLHGIVTKASPKWEPKVKFTLQSGNDVFEATIDCFCPVAVGDIVHGEYDTKSNTFWSRPIVVIPETDENVALFLSTETQLRQDIIARLITNIGEAANELGEPSVCRYLNRMASRSQMGERGGERVISTVRDVTGLSLEQTRFLLGKWVQRRLCRQLYVLGMSKLAIEESLDLLKATHFLESKPPPTLSTLYEAIVANPLAYAPLEDSLQSVLSRLFNHKHTPTDIIANRVARAVYNASKYASHTYLTTDVLILIVADWELARPHFYRFHLQIEENRIYLSKQYVVEKIATDRLTQKIQTMKEAKDLPDAPILDTYECKTLSDDQKKAVSCSLNYPLSAITGGPGTGKTKIITEVVLNLTRRGIPYTVAAFTGKAVARVKESAKFEILVATLDRIIATAAQWPKFGYLIIDEASMVTSELMWRFFNAFPPNHYDILLVGDVDQLTPLGWGAFFPPLLASGKIPVHRLEYNYRSQLSGAGIVTNSRMLVQPFRDLHLPVQFENSDTFVEMKGDHTVVVDILKGFKEVGWKADDITIITPYNEEVKRINPIFQEIFGEGPIREIDGRTWRVTDRVMMTVNSYDINVMNGETGKVTEMNSVTVTVRFDSGVTFAFPHKPQHFNKQKADSEGTIKTDLWVGHLLHAYAISVHRSQGSEYPIAIVYLPERRTGGGNGSFLNINLLYTALTRASRAAWLIHGGDSLFNCTSHRPAHRNDWLLQRLMGANEGIEFERVFEILEHTPDMNDDEDMERMMELYGL